MGLTSESAEKHQLAMLSTTVSNGLAQEAHHRCYHGKYLNYVVVSPHPTRQLFKTTGEEQGEGQGGC